MFTPFLDTASDVVFTRVGAVYPDSVKIVARYPELNSTGEVLRRLIYREAKIFEPEPWKDGPLMAFTKDKDWVDTVKLTGLWPNTSYECKFEPSSYSMDNRLFLNTPQIHYLPSTGQFYLIQHLPSAFAPFPTLAFQQETSSNLSSPLV